MSYPRRKTKPTGTKAERATAARLEADLVDASGALDGRKSDMTLPDFRVENKATEKGSIRLELDWLLKIAHEAAETGRTPALTVQFVTGNGKPRPQGAWVVIPEHVFKEIVDA